jgi:hypothetical protein
MSSQSHRRTLPLATALLALVLTTPAVPAIAAGNTSAEPPPPNFPTAVPTRPGALTQPADTSVAPAATNAHNKRNRRSADANVGSYTPGATPAVAYTSGATPGEASTPGASAGDSATRPSVPGPPTWPVNPQPIKPVPAVHASDTGGGLDRTTIGLGIAGGLLAIGGIVGIARRSRRIERARVTA